jgi:hypothetical protein
MSMTGMGKRRRLRTPKKGSEPLAIEMLDQRQDRVGKSVLEFDPEIEPMAALALPGPDDLSVHLEGLMGSPEVDVDPDDRTDVVIHPAPDPGP